MPPLQTMPNIVTLILKANSMTAFELQCSKINFANIQKIDARNNKIVMSEAEILRLADKVVNFKKLKYLNLENNETDIE